MKSTINKVLTKIPNANDNNRTTHFFSAPAYGTLYQLLRRIFTGLLLFTVVIVYVPLDPSMPNVGGDNSWMFAVNQAVAQKLTFGKDLVFTFGPYAAMYTKTYHPATDHLMMIGGLLLALFSAFLIYHLSKGRSLVWQLFLIVFLSAGMFSRDTVLFLYPLLVIFFVYLAVKERKDSTTFSTRQKLVCGSLFIPFGLLILIKGTLVILTAGFTILCAVLFWRRGMRKLAITACAVPLVSMCIFLLIAGQEIAAIWYYVVNLAEVSTGYTEAMFRDGPRGQIILYIVSSITMVAFCFTERLISLEKRLFLSVALTIYLFLAFKAGFTRHDAHALTAATAVFTGAFFPHTVLNNNSLYLSFFLAAVTWLHISYYYMGQGVFNVFKQVPDLYTEALDGLMTRLSADRNLKDKYYQRLADIRTQEPHVPVLAGTTDLYSYEQTYLLATKNRWSPRPVIQSYSAYTPKLAKLNEKHLTNKGAPKNIIFRLQTIDNRIPALDDGLSWPTIINNYRPGPIDAGFMFLRQNRPQNISPARTVIYSKSCHLNDEVTMPADTTEMLFAQFDIRKTVWGSLISAIYKPEPIDIRITLADGSQRTHRIVPTMLKAGFILSPFIENIHEFGLLFNNVSALRGKNVKSFKIINKGVGFRSKIPSWRNEYVVSLSKITFDK